MKKGFGWFFLIIGILNILRAIAIGVLPTGANPIWIALFGFGLFILGSWMISDASSKEEPQEEANKPMTVSQKTTISIPKTSDYSGGYNGGHNNHQSNQISQLNQNQQNNTEDIIISYSEEYNGNLYN